MAETGDVTGRPDGMFARVLCACGRHNVARGPWFPARPGELHAYAHCWRWRHGARAAIVATRGTKS